ALYLFAVALVPLPESLRGVVGLLAACGVAFALPLMSGLAAGWLAPTRQALGAFFALAGLLPFVALILSGQMQPVDSNAYSSTINDWGIMMLSCWMPIGCAGAALGGWF